MLTGDGKVDLAEFFLLATHLQMGKADQEALKSAFKVFDKNKNNRICKVRATSITQTVQSDCVFLHCST